MRDEILDYRSDTFTKPTMEMRQAMANADVGDDVFGEDPTVNRLQEYVAELLGKEAALYVPSGSMSNQIAVMTHCRPGDEFICETGCHIYNYEQAAFAQLGGVACRTLQGEYGVLRPEQFHGTIRAIDSHQVRTRLVCLENTHNRGAGKIQPYDGVVEICRWAREHELGTHLDGARLLNAVVATGISAVEWTDHFDTVSICFSKGLGAPVGSALAGPREFIKAAHRKRKCLGGAMRQAGVIAAGAQYALENHVERLADDHAHATQLADAIRQISGLSLCPEQIDTNIVIFEIDEQLGTASEFVDRLRESGLLMLAVGANQARAVTHMDVPLGAADHAAEILQAVVSERAAVA